MTKHRNHLPTLLREKAKQSTYPVVTGLHHLLSISEQGPDELPPSLQLPGNSPMLRQVLLDAINATNKLRELRQTTSHHKDIESLEKDLSELLEKLATTIEKAGKGAT